MALDVDAVAMGGEADGIGSLGVGDADVEMGMGG